MKLISILGLSVLMLSGCMSAQERYLARTAAGDAKCQSYGFKIGTNEYAQCRMSVDQAADQADQQRRVALGHAIDQMGQQQQENYRIQMQAIAANRPVMAAPTHCNSSVMGSMISTNCY